MAFKRDSSGRCAPRRTPAGAPQVARRARKIGFKAEAPRPASRNTDHKLLESLGEARSGRRKRPLCRARVSIGRGASPELRHRTRKELTGASHSRLLRLPKTLEAPVHQVVGARHVARLHVSRCLSKSAPTVQAAQNLPMLQEMASNTLRSNHLGSSLPSNQAGLSRPCAVPIATPNPGILCRDVFDGQLSPSFLIPPKYSYPSKQHMAWYSTSSPERMLNRCQYRPAAGRPHN